MGFLDNTTNNIILDAVLTDTGRQFLARNDGSFSIFKFGLGDDEINYGIITKYGQSVGKEKIIKNTPIFEASTDPAGALRSNLVSISNPNLVYMPTLKLTTANTSVQISVNNASQRLQTISVEQTLGTNSGAPGSIDVELQDVMYQVNMNNLFLEISGGGNNLILVDSQQRASYRLAPTQNRNSVNGTSLSFQVSTKSLSTQMFSIYGSNNQISTFVNVKGMQSGASIDIPVIISLN